ncbi:MAG: hypothetical protein JEY91_02005 [Spirochaetaceae bacterium]|nr:hypothetical protein [Spirochaetaceae bacterium]
MNKITLKNSDLTISMLQPGTKYTRSRFDWTGVVDQISLGGITFLGKEACGSYTGSEGLGLSTEFGISTPLSYWKTLPGKQFMKIGVGALKRRSLKPYSFFDEYDVSPFKTEVKTYDDRVEFLQKNCTVGSYRYDYTKKIRIEDNSLLMEYHLKNTGESRIKTEEYCHNFFRLGDKDISEHIEVETNYPLKSRKLVGELEVNGKKISIKTKPEKMIYTYSLLKEKPDDFSWKLKNKRNNISISGFESFPVSKFALWGMKHVISPETFYSFSLQPGAEQKWSRKYVFEA